MKVISLVIGLVLNFGPLLVLAEESTESTFAEFAEKKRRECLEHFDITPFQAMASREDLGKYYKSKEEIEAFENIIATYLKTGKLALSPEKQNDAKAIECAILAEGIIDGSVLLIQAMVHELIEQERAKRPDGKTGPGGGKQGLGGPAGRPGPGPGGGGSFPKRR